MTYPFTSPRLVFPTLICLLAGAFTNCKDDAASPSSIGGAGEAGTAGDVGSSGAVGQGATLCAVPGAVSECDPVTAVPCDIINGQTCDYSNSLGGFKCYDGPNTSGPGDFCDTSTALCAASTTCNVDLAQCEHYCCSDADCQHGACEHAVFADGPATVGTCTGEFQVAAGSSGAGGATDGSAGAGG